MYKGKLKPSNIDNNNKLAESGGFFDIPQSGVCQDKGHNFPTHLSIPYGKGYKHVCPSCGNVIIVTNPAGLPITFPTFPDYSPMPHNPFLPFPFKPNTPGFGGTEFYD